MKQSMLSIRKADRKGNNHIRLLTLNITNKIKKLKWTSPNKFLILFVPPYHTRQRKFSGVKLLHYGSQELENIREFAKFKKIRSVCGIKMLYYCYMNIGIRQDLILCPLKII